jgi:hypothetical protein
MYKKEKGKMKMPDPKKMKTVPSMMGYGKKGGKITSKSKSKPKS